MHIYCNLIETDKTFGHKKLYKCQNCGIELALENSNINILCFKSNLDMAKDLIQQNLKDHPIYRGVNYGPDTDFMTATFNTDNNPQASSSPQENQIKPNEDQLPKDKAPQAPVLCTKEEIDARLKICGECEYYQEDACILCGCRIVREANHQNKLANKNASCPAGKWGPIKN